MKAHELLADKGHWIAGDVARTKYGESVASRSASAVKWCALGALEYCYGYAEANLLFQKITADIGRDITSVNDGDGGYNSIMAILRRFDV